MKKWLLLTHSTITVTENFGRQIKMRIWNFLFLLVSLGFSLISAQKDFSENEDPTSTPDKSMSNENQSKPMEKISQGGSSKANGKNQPRQRKPEYPTAQDPNLITQPRLYYPVFVDGGAAIPPLGFSGPGKQRQNIYLSDHTGYYDLKLRNFQQGKPSDFQTALGAISAHILNQRNNQEYIPYPPNGNPYNYPAYRGHPQAKEPPVVRAYERASNSNYDAQPADFDQENPRRLLAPTNYQRGFPNQFQNSGFYAGPEFFNGGAFYSELRRSSDPLFDSRWPNQGEGYQWPIK